MIHNLFLSYDLMKPGQNYATVQHRIKQLGRWYRVQFSLYYVQSPLDMRAAHDFVRAVMDSDDKLAVIDAENAYVSSVPTGDLAALQTVFAQALQPA